MMGVPTLPARTIGKAPLSEVSHRPAGLFAAFDDPDLIAHAGLVPVIRLAERCGLPALVAEKVRLTGARNGAGTAADAKALSIVGGWWPGQTASMTWTCCATAACPACSARCAPRRRWGRSCARSPGGTCANWSPPTGVHLQSGLAHRRWSPPGTRWCSWTSTPRSSRSTGRPSRAPPSATPSSAACTSRSSPSRRAPARR